MEPPTSKQSVYQRLIESWATPKGALVIFAWTSAITGVTLWSLSRRKLEKKIGQQIAVHLPSVAERAKQSKSLFKDEEDLKAIQTLHSEQNWRYSVPLSISAYPRHTAPRVFYVFPKARPQLRAQSHGHP